MKLNKRNGNVTIGNVEISAAFSLPDVEKLKSRYDIRSASQHPDYGVFYLSNLDDQLWVMLNYYQDALQRINIGVNIKDKQPYIVSQKERDMLAVLFEDITPPTNYPWGFIELYEDRKGGKISIIIHYTN